MGWGDLLQREIWGNSVQAWAISLTLVLIVTIGLRSAARIALKRVAALAAKTQTGLDDLAVELLSKTQTLAIFLVAIWAAARPLTIEPGAEAVLSGVLVVGVLLQAGFWGMGVINYASLRWRRQQLQHDPSLATAMGALGFVLKLALWSVLAITALANLGVDITAFVASLGIGGIAIALALQNVLGDLFASLSIVLDKPFVIGDFVIVDDLVGTVEHVGLKTTRIRSISGEQLVVSNADLLSSRIRNYKRMSERRIAFTFGVTYDTPPAALRGIPGLVARVVRDQEHTRFDRCHLKALAAHSLDFETVYYLTVPDYEAYMDVQQAVNLALIEAFADDGIEFAFPTQTLYVVGADGAGNGAADMAADGAEWAEGAERGSGVQDTAE